MIDRITMRVLMLFWALAVWFGPTTAATTGFAVECDGNQAMIAYDAPSFSSFNYDSGAVLLAGGGSERSQRPDVHFTRFAKFLAAKGGSLWKSGPPGIQVRQFGDWWVKRVNPDANSFMQWWGQKSINAQYGGLQKLGDMATPNAMRNGALFTKDVGATLPDGFRLFNPVSREAYLKGSSRMGTFFNDIQPRNMGANGLIFDPAIDPVTKAFFYGGVGVAIGYGTYQMMNQ